VQRAAVVETFFDSAGRCDRSPARPAARRGGYSAGSRGPAGCSYDWPQQLLPVDLAVHDAPHLSSAVEIWSLHAHLVAGVRLRLEPFSAVLSGFERFRAAELRSERL
jgi:hypothetical protein